MRTDELIAMLARDAGPVRPAAFGGRFATGLLLSLPVSLLLMVTLVGSIRFDAPRAGPGAIDLLKFGLVLALLAAGGLACVRLARPGASTAGIVTAVVVPVAAVSAAALATLAGAEPGARLALVLGDTWTVCTRNIALLSAPVFVAAIVAMRGLAPTRLRRAGAAAGLLAGGAGASVYALHCPEVAAPFLAVWYLLGIAVPVAVGALLGPRLLRW